MIELNEGLAGLVLGIAKKCKRVAHARALIPNPSPALREKGGERGLDCRVMRALVWATLGLSLIFSQGASAQVPHDTCQELGAWARSCDVSSDCNGGRVCIAELPGAQGTCRERCVSTTGPTTGEADPALCAYGEACLVGEEKEARETRYCKPVPFTMDLNLLDSCIYHFVEGLEPIGATDTNVCSLTRNLATMLERDGTPGFGIFDLDRCVLDFLAQEPESACADGTCLHCTTDEACGEGAYCNPDLSRCERECGPIVDRSQEGMKALRRSCSGRMKVCNEGRGRCDDFVIGGQTCDSWQDCARGADCIEHKCEMVPPQCEVDVDCPVGAYCFLGECQPRCYRSLECPDSNWFCSSENKCERKPSATQAASFEPQRYSILFGVQAIKIDGVNAAQELPLLIMDTDSSRAVFGDPNILFGYRLQVTYGRKQDPLCVGDLMRVDAQKIPALTDKQRADCVISPQEEFLTLDNPFGTIFGDGRQGLGVRLNARAAKDLTPGRYAANVRAVFSNGSSTTASVTFDKPTPDGRYRGQLEIGVDDPRANLIAVTEASLGLRVHMDQERNWDQLLDENHIIDLKKDGKLDEREFRDITFGYLVEGAIYGHDSLVFSQPTALTDATNEIPVRGLYSPQYRRMRLISVVDIDPAAKWCRDGSCTLGANEAEQLKVQNVFARAIRRKIEWVGTFDDVTGRFDGIYRETLSGLLPHQVTLQGKFDLVQTQQDAGIGFVRKVEEPLLPVGGERAVPFPNRASLYASHDARLTAACKGVTDAGNKLAEALAKFSDKGVFVEYIGGIDQSPIFPAVRDVGGRVAEVLGAMGGNISAASLSISDMLRDSIKRCDATPRAPVCVDVKALECGLALHAKALLAGSPPSDDALRCDRSDSNQCGKNERCVFDVNLRSGRCRVGCDGPVPTACAADQLCTAGGSVEGTGTHFCKPAFGGWVNRGAVVREMTTGAGDKARTQLAPVFCDRRALETDKACLPSAATPNVSALQEYTWFYKSLHETLAYEAGQDVSDAFFLPYRDQYISGAGALNLTAAYREKVRLLKSALTRYDASRKQLFDPVTTQVLVDWPMAQFDTQGKAWLAQMHAVLSDRTQTLYELVDLQRRVLRPEMSRDPLFYNQLFQQEYLAQVYLAALQAHWQGPQFAYAGEGPKALAQGDQILRKVAQVNNPLGLKPNRAYFENSAATGAQSNVELFRQRASQKLVELIGTDGRSGLVGLAKADLRQALASKHQLISDLDALKDQLDDELLRLCGEDRELPKGCAKLGNLDRSLVNECTGDDCAVTFQCEDDSCKRVSRLFTDKLKTTLQEAACRADTPRYHVYRNPPPRVVEEDADGKPVDGTGTGLVDFMHEDDLESRLCVRGEVGRLLQERASLELSRQDTLGRANDLLRQLSIKAELMSKVGKEYDSLRKFLISHQAATTIIEETWTTANTAHGVVNALSFGADCITIAIIGQASGGGDNCASKVAFAANVLTPARFSYTVAQGAYATAKLAADVAKTIRVNDFEKDSQVNAIKSEMDSLSSQLEGLIGQYQMVIQQMQSVDIQTADALALAQSRWNSYTTEVNEVAEGLTGQDSHWALLRNSAALQSQQKFNNLLLDVYKLVQAVSYRYDLPKGESLALQNQAYQIVTAGQVRAFLEDIDCRLTQFAGSNDLDPNWDAASNASLFIMSLRKQLFPGLTDSVDPKTSKLLTADEQFHRIITSPPYLRTVVANGLSEKRIVIPFATWMDVRVDSLVGQPALVNRNTCNHVLVGDTEQGSVALNFEMWNERPRSAEDEARLHAWLRRGTIDHMRSCDEEYPQSRMPVVQPYTFGNAYHDSNVPIPSVATGFDACVNKIDDPMCWKNVFGERTLGSPDWVVEIDALGSNEDNGWLLAAYGPEDHPPVIRDVQLAFRYTDRPRGTVKFECR